MLEWAKRRMPSREAILRIRFLRPFTRHLVDPSLWHLNRQSVARGVAVGMFIGILIPVAQTPFAALASVPVRGNVAIAALTTFITNPFTTPAILYAAYETGSWMLRSRSPGVAEVTQAADAWITRAVTWVIDVSGPTALGLLVFSLLGAFLSYWLVQFAWRIWVSRRWTARRARRGA